MHITNNFDLPLPFFTMASADQFPLKDKTYRVTSLLKGVRETILERRHDAEITKDVSEMVWLLFGTAVHNILEAQPESDTQIKEERLTVPFGSYMLTGKFDLYDADTETVTDYKTASVWKIMFGDYSDWRRQLLIYCYMLRRIGFPANKGRIVAFLKDHNKRNAKYKEGYPKKPVQTVEFTFDEEDFKECEEWLTARFALISVAEQMTDDELPICSPEERFNSGDKYAVMAKGKKKASRVLDTREEAELWMMNHGGDHIEYRPGEDKKCLEYCSACEFCNYYKERYGNE